MLIPSNPKHVSFANDKERKKEQGGAKRERGADSERERKKLKTAVTLKEKYTNGTREMCRCKIKPTKMPTFTFKEKTSRAELNLEEPEPATLPHSEDDG